MESPNRVSTSSEALSPIEMEALRLDIEATFLADQEKREAKNAAFLERIRRPYAEYKNDHPRGDLCRRCASVNWSLLLPSEASHYCEDTDNLTLFSVPESSQELSASSCPLCLFLSSAHSFGKNPKRTLAAHCACATKPWRSDCDSKIGHSDLDWTYHALCLELIGERHPESSRFILQPTCTTTQGFRLRELDPEVIDFEIPRQWLKRCQRHHPANCNLTFASTIPGLRVFDCKVGKVVAAPENTAISYIALSYVWGGVKISKNDQADFPSTIRDAITVTLEMGFKYLWVDQLVRSCLKDGVSGTG